MELGTLWAGVSQKIEMYLEKVGSPLGQGLRFRCLSERDEEKGPQTLLWGQNQQQAGVRGSGGRLRVWEQVALAY